VPESSDEYKEVVYDILARDVFVTKYEIRRLQRIQNPSLWAGYRAYRESKKKPNEIWAVHGSVLDSLDNIFLPPSSDVSHTCRLKKKNWSVSLSRS
jgi:hypothetical protein